MANMIGAVIEPGRIWVKSPFGEGELTKAQIKANYQSQNGNAAARKAATIQWVKEWIWTTCGGDNWGPVGSISFEVDLTDDGKVMWLEIE